MGDGTQGYADYCDEQAEATAWHGPAVLHGPTYPYIQAGQSLLDLGTGTGLGSVPFGGASPFAGTASNLTCRGGVTRFESVSDGLGLRFVQSRRTGDADRLRA